MFGKRSKEDEELIENLKLINIKYNEKINMLDNLNNNLSRELESIKRIHHDRMTADHFVVPTKEIGLEKYRNMAVISQFTEDEIETHDVNVNGRMTPKQFQLRKHYTVLSKFEEPLLVELRKQIEVGVENYPKFDAMVEELDKIKEETLRQSEDRKKVDEELLYNRKLLQFFAIKIGQAKFDSIETDFKRRLTEKEQVEELGL